MPRHALDRRSIEQVRSVFDDDAYLLAFVGHRDIEIEFRRLGAHSLQARMRSARRGSSAPPAVVDPSAIPAPAGRPASASNTRAAPSAPLPAIALAAKPHSRRTAREAPAAARASPSCRLRKGPTAPV